MCLYTKYMYIHLYTKATLAVIDWEMMLVSAFFCARLHRGWIGANNCLLGNNCLKLKRKLCPSQSELWVNRKCEDIKWSRASRDVDANASQAFSGLHLSMPDWSECQNRDLLASPITFAFLFTFLFNSPVSIASLRESLNSFKSKKESFKSKFGHV